MTLSVLAYDKSSQSIGVASATGNLAVGAWVPRAKAGVGGVLTQGLSPSTVWGDKAIALLDKGLQATDVVKHVTEQDPGREHRQLAVMDVKGDVGQFAVHTGKRNHEVKGHIGSPDALFVGNWLSSMDVLHAMRDSYDSYQQDGVKNEFGRQLLCALQAGINAGSDSRGTLSAAMLIVRPDLPPTDLRIDYGDLPVDQLSKLYEMTTSGDYADWFAKLPTIKEPKRH